MIYPKCNSEIKDGSKFCSNCGEPLPKMKKNIEYSYKALSFSYNDILFFFFFILFVIAPGAYKSNAQQVRNTYNSRSRIIQNRNQQKGVRYYGHPRTNQRNVHQNTLYNSRSRLGQENVQQQEQSDSVYNIYQQKETEYYSLPRKVRQNTLYNTRSELRQENVQQQNEIQFQYVDAVASPNDEPIKNTASSDLKTIRLVVSGEGSTKEEATKVALRSAIEQTFGTFVSSNTDVLNDDIIKDEIATVASGNIQSYKELSSENLGTTKIVNIEAVVSIGKLISFAKSKGMETELAGATFAMNMKMKELNKKNERVALANLYKQLDMIASNTNLFNYELTTGEPYQVEGVFYAVDVTVNIRANENAEEFAKTYINTMKSLSLTDTEKEEYKKANLEYYSIEYGGIPSWSYGEASQSPYYVRNYYLPRANSCEYSPVELAFIKSMLKFKLVDNLGNSVIMLYTLNPQIRNYRVNILNTVKQYSLNSGNTFSEPLKDYIFFATAIGDSDNFYNHQVNRGWHENWRSPLFDFYLRGENQIRNSDIFVQLVFKLYYTKEVFEKLSSIKVEPTNEIEYYDLK